MDNDQLKDDFDNDPEVLQWRKEQADHLKMIDDSIAIICNAFDAKQSSTPSLEDFISFKSIDNSSVADAYTGKWNNDPVSFFIFQYYTSVRVGRGSSSGSDEYFGGIISLKTAYPHTIIQPETLELKIGNLFTRADVDFKQAKKFSFLFFVATKDKTALEVILHSKDLDRLCKFRNAELEIIGTQCYFRLNRKPIAIEEAKEFAELAKIIAEVF